MSNTNQWEGITLSLLKLIRQAKALETRFNHKPDWATHYTNRQWRKHSALLTCQHEMFRDHSL